MGAGIEPADVKLPGFEYDGHVLVLNSTTLYQVRSAHALLRPHTAQAMEAHPTRVFLVEFFAPWCVDGVGVASTTHRAPRRCGRCTELAPHYVEAASHLLVRAPQAVLAKLNGANTHPLAHIRISKPEIDQSLMIV